MHTHAMPRFHSLARDATAVLVTTIFALPIIWWALSSITPTGALLDLRKMLTLDFTPAFDHFALAILGKAGTIYDSRQSLVDSVVVAMLSTLFTLVAALPAASILSRSHFAGRATLLNLFLLQRFLPAITLVFPLVVLYHMAGLVDSRIGLAFAHAGLNLPIAVLLLKSFFDDVPPEVGDAAKIDGATLLQSFLRVFLPSIRSGIAAAAVLCFIFSWTDFLISLFLTQNMRLVPVQAQILNMNMWGLVSALTTTASVPAFVFVLLMQKHLVRGLTMGLYK